MPSRLTQTLVCAAILVVALGNSARASVYTQTLAVSFGASYTSQAANVLCTVTDYAGTVQIAATNEPDGAHPFAEETDAAAVADTGCYRCLCTTFNTAWLPATVKFTITGQSAVLAETVLGTDRGASASDGYTAANGTKLTSLQLDGSSYVKSNVQTMAATALAPTGFLDGTSIANIWSTAVPGAFGAGTAGKALAYISATPPTVAQIAAGILATPGNLLLTDSSGRVSLNLNQPLDLTNLGDTAGGALVAARAQGFGKWIIAGSTLTMYAADGATILRTFTVTPAPTSAASRQ